MCNNNREDEKESKVLVKKDKLNSWLSLLALGIIDVSWIGDIITNSTTESASIFYINLIKVICLSGVLLIGVYSDILNKGKSILMYYVFQTLLISALVLSLISLVIL